MKAQGDWWILSRPRARFADPANRYFAKFASPWRRAAAAAIDWMLCYVAFVLVSIPLGILESLGTISREEGDFGGLPGHVLQVTAQLLTIAPVVGYFALLSPTSQTLGMRARDIHRVSTRTGRGSAYPTAIVRAVIATLMAAAFYAVYLDLTSYEKDRQLDSTSTFLLQCSYVLVAVGCVSALVLIFAPTHRSLVDRLFGTAVVDELEAVNPRVGPWGPLDVFDVSHGGQAARS